MTRTSTGLFVALSLVGSAAVAETSGNVTFASDYIYRGISQTQEEFAIQGGMDFTSAAGWYLGAWASNVDFNSDASAEIDVYLGWSHESGDKLRYDFGLLYYGYPAETDLDFLEIYAGFGLGVFDFKYSYSDDFAGTGDDGQYFEGGVELPLGEHFAVSGHVGQSSFGNNVGLEDYVDYQVAIAATMERLTLTVAYHDTDADELGNLADERIVVLLTLE